MADVNTEVVAAHAGGPSLDVLLSTYQGARYLPEQLDSILAQSRPGLRILVRDDGSSDTTSAVLADYAARYPEIVRIDDHRAGLGACGSFVALLERSDADYVFFCDQDDVWLPGRLDRMLNGMRELQRQFGANRPFLVHSDLVVVDASLRLLHPSFCAYQYLDPVRGGTLPRLLVQNVVTGCAAMINRALARRAVPIPPEAVMHDWWLALVAAAVGRIGWLPEPTILYRQHDANRVGAKRWGPGYVLRHAIELFAEEGAGMRLRDGQRQAAALLAHLGPDMPEVLRRTVMAYANLSRYNVLARRILLLRHGVRKTGWARNLGMWMRI
jgi:glycosyltransferase involved in cell wall biosynthesis